MNNAGERDIFYLGNDEMNLLDAYRELKRYNPKGNFVLFDTDNYTSFNIATGKKVVLVQEEVDNGSKEKG